VFLDGRVLVSGSDPTCELTLRDVLEDTADFPEEFRVEVFTPPHLLSGLPRPTFTLTNTDLLYGNLWPWRSRLAPPRTSRSRCSALLLVCMTTVWVREPFFLSCLVKGRLVQLLHC
jgi:hypothetical protein